MIRAFVDKMQYEEGGRRLTLTVHHAESEKRKHDRIAWLRPVLVSPIDESGQVDPSQQQQAWAKNISPTGIGLLQSRLSEQRRVLITIPMEGDTVSVQAEVRHWHSLGDNVLEVGCRLETPPVEPDAKSQAEPLARLITRLAVEQLPQVERRVAPRWPYTQPIMIFAADGREIRGFARDLSRSGIAFFTTKPLAEEVLRLSLPQGDLDTAVCVKAKVVRCVRLTDELYDTAAQFLGG